MKVYILLEHATEETCYFDFSPATAKRDAIVHGVYTSRFAAEIARGRLLHRTMGGYLCVLSKTLKGATTIANVPSKSLIVIR